MDAHTVVYNVVSHSFPYQSAHGVPLYPAVHTRRIRLPGLATRSLSSSTQPDSSLIVRVPDGVSGQALVSGRGDVQPVAGDPCHAAACLAGEDHSEPGIAASSTTQ